MMKASPLLRAWLARLETRGVRLHRRHRWVGWAADGQLRFHTPSGDVLRSSDAVILALGGGSWQRLGSDGAWAPLVTANGVETLPFGPSNGAYIVPWSNVMKDRFAGEPVKSVRTTLATPNGPAVSRAEFVITKGGLESGMVYALSAQINAALDSVGTAQLSLDLAPDRDVRDLASALARVPKKQSMSNKLRKAARLSPVKIALLREAGGDLQAMTLDALAARIKAVPISIIAPAPLDEAISTTGGVAWSALDENFMICTVPGTFCAGEMIGWDAPTGGYLLTACLATGRAAAEGVDRYLKS